MKRNSWEQKFDQAMLIADRVKRLVALEDLRQEIGLHENWKDDDARALLGRTDRDPGEWGPLSIAIHQTKNALRLPPKRSNWSKYTPVVSHTRVPGSNIYKPVVDWDRLVHKASIQADAALQRAQLQDTKPRSTKIEVLSGWITF